MIKAILIYLLILAVVTGYGFFPVISGQVSNQSRCDAEVCQVQITKDGFVPSKLVIKRGTTVVWTNLDDSRHTVTSGSPGEIRAPLKSRLLEKGGQYEFTFNHAGMYEGSYKYFDQVTQIMRGEIVVEVEPPPPVQEKPLPGIKIDYTDPRLGISSFSLSNGNITHMELLPDSNSLRIGLTNILTLSKLEITLDRNLIDSKNGTRDAPFEVKIDGKEGFHEEISSLPAQRTLEIAVPENSTTLEIIGTNVSSEILGLTDAETAITKANSTISSYKEEGLVVTEAAKELADAEKAFDAGKYSVAEMFAIEAERIANNINQTASLASKALMEADLSINQVNMTGVDVSVAQNLFTRAEERMMDGDYDMALSLAEQAKTAAINAVTLARSSPSDPDSSPSNPLDIGDGIVEGGGFPVAIIAASAAGAAAAAAVAVLYTRSRRKTAMEKTVTEAPDAAKKEKPRTIDVDRIFAENPNLRYDDRDVIKYLAEKGGEALESEIRDKFKLPRTSAWRLVKRLESEDIVEISKIGVQNLIKIRDEFTRKGPEVGRT